MSIDNMQRFERLRDDALYLQKLADSRADIDHINELTKLLRVDELYDYPVVITGGLVEVKAIDEELDHIVKFIPNTTEISGSYKGLSWKHETLEFPDGSREISWLLCHSIGSETTSYIDSNGDRIVRTPLTNVTVEGSSVDFMSPVGVHDYRALALDGLCLKIDQVAMDDTLDINDKSELLSKLFKIRGTSDKNEVFAKRTRQRISYLNEIGLFSGVIVSSPIAVRRTEQGVELLKTRDDNIIAEVLYIALENEISPDFDWVDDTSTISYEVDMSGIGHLSIPHISGITKLYHI